MGDLNDIGLDEGYVGDVCDGTTAIQVTYSAQGSNGWAGVYWQEPEGNWGTIPDAGFNLTDFDTLLFCSRGETGGEIIEIGMGGLGRNPNNCNPIEPFPDSACKTATFITLTDTWQTYTIDLSGVDLSYTIGGFLWTANRPNNPGGATFYLDTIRYATNSTTWLSDWFLPNWEAMFAFTGIQSPWLDP